MLESLSLFFFFIILVLPLASAIYLIAKKKKHFSHWFFWFMIVSVASYLLIMASVQITELDLKNKLDQHDLDGDGIFSQEEQTPEMEEAMARLTSDTGRSLAPITALFTCPIYSAFWHALIGFPYLIFHYFKTNPKAEILH